METPEEVWQKLEAVREGTLQRLASFSQEELDRRPAAEEGEEAWSPGEIFMHLAIDEVYVREMIARPLLEGVKPAEGVRFLPPPPPYGMAKEVIKFWFERARLSTRRLFEAWPESPEMQLEHEGGLRPMNGLQWLYAYTGHEELHQRQIDEMEKQ